MKKLLSKLMGVILMLAILIGGIYLWSFWDNRNFQETFYSVYSYKIKEPVRAVLLTDLHQHTFGTANETLVTRIEKLEPDVILMGGDIINRKNTNISYAVDLCEDLVQIAPVYYALGNHENEVVYGEEIGKDALEKRAELLGDKISDFSPLIQDSSLLDELTSVGVHVILNGYETVEINGTNFEIGGVSTNLSSFWPYSGEFIYDWVTQTKDAFKLLICHRPEPAAEYLSDYPLDLIVSGHNHGGIIQIPGKGGLFAMDQGFFPEYDAGMIETDSTKIIISRGMGNHELIPRINNRPELVVIDMH